MREIDHISDELLFDEAVLKLMVLGAAVSVPEDEGTGVDLAELDWRLWRPPTADDDLVTWENDSFVCPERIIVDFAGVADEVLHHDHALEAWNVLLSG